MKWSECFRGILCMGCFGLSVAGCATTHSDTGGVCCAAGGTEETQEEDFEEEILMSQCPAEVQEAALRLASAEAIREVMREIEDGVVTYNIEYMDGQREMSAEFDATGKLLELEREDGAEDEDDMEGEH